VPSPKTDLSSRRRFHHSAVQTGPHSGLDFGPMGDTHHFNAQPPLGLPMWRCVCLCVCLCVCCDCVLLAAEFGKWCGPCPSISETPAASLHVHGQPSYPVASRPLEHCLQIYLKLLVNMPKIRGFKTTGKHAENPRLCCAEQLLATSSEGTRTRLACFRMEEDQEQLSPG
jgi:hypothetical protein